MTKYFYAYKKIHSDQTWLQWYITANYATKLVKKDHR